MPSTNVAAVDIGGTTIRVVIFDNATSATIVARDQFRHSRNKNVPDDIAKLGAMITDLGGTVSHVGIGVAGVVDTKLGGITASGNLSGWHGVSVRSGLLKHFPEAEVRIENDAQVAARGEAVFGHGADKDDMWFVIVGSGVGGAVVEWLPDGSYRINPQEPGHITVEHNGRLCGCGLKGCAHAYLGGRDLERHYGVDSAEMLEENQWEEWCEYMAIALNNLLNTFNTPVVYFGGGVILNQAHRLPRIIELTEQRAMRPLPRYLTAKHAHDTGLYGALALLR